MTENNSVIHFPINLDRNIAVASRSLEYHWIRKWNPFSTARNKSRDSVGL